MIRRGKGWIPAAAVMCWLCSAGCATVTMTAANSINPVMFGSAKPMGAGTATRKSSCVTGSTVFHHREDISGMAIFLGNGVAFGASSTDPAGDDERSPDWSANLTGGVVNPARLDWKVFRATGENRARRVELTSIRCGGFNSVFLFGIMGTNGCELEGIAPAAE